MKTHCYEDRLPLESKWPLFILLFFTLCLSGRLHAQIDEESWAEAKLLSEWHETIDWKGEWVTVRAVRKELPWGEHAIRYFLESGEALPDYLGTLKTKQWANTKALNIPAAQSPVSDPSQEKTTRMPFSARTLLTKSAQTSTARTQLEAPTPQELASIEDDSKFGGGEKGPRRIGFARTLPQNIQLAGKTTSLASDKQWTPVEGGYLWQHQFSSKTAYGIRLLFKNVQLPKGATLCVHDVLDPASSYFFHESKDIPLSGELWSSTIHAGQVGLEVFLPHSKSPRSFSLTIDSLMHLDSDVFATTELSKEGTCHNHIACYSGWLSTASSVAHISFISGGRSFVCTGALLNDNDTSGFIPYFLTAFHCIDSQSVANTVEFYWNFQAGICNGFPPSVGSVPRTTGGARFLAGQSRNSGNDFALLRINNTPPGGLIFAGWNTAPLSVGTEVAGVHHPAGTHKRISFGRIGNRSDFNFWEVIWFSGVTEGGSSGSPIFNANQQIVGQLWGGSSFCFDPQAPDYYGRFNVSYPIIATYLDGGDGGLPNPDEVFNDNFRDRSVLTGRSASFQVTNVGASKEAREPNHAGNIGGRSVWWEWIAPGDGRLTVTTRGSDFDTILGVYSGTSVGSLTTLASNDDDPSAFDLTSALTVQNVVAGRAYQIAVDGYNGASGNVVINLFYEGSGGGNNDNFSNATELTQPSDTIEANTQDATEENGEPVHGGVGGGRTIWYRWTSSEPGFMTMNTQGSTFDTVIAVYSGNSLNALSLEVYNDDTGVSGVRTSRVDFNVEAGITYHIAIDGFAGDAGDVILNYSFLVSDTRDNDHFSDSRSVIGTSITATASNAQASKESGEPFHAGNSGGRSLWWKWQAPASGQVVITTAGSLFDTLLGVYRGNAVSNLQTVASADDSLGALTSSVTFETVKDQEYHIAVDGYGGDSGLVVLSIEMDLSTTDLLFVNRPELEGDWVQTGWMDGVNLSYIPWYHHIRLGWIRVSSNAESNVWFFMPGYGWHWTSNTVYPYVYDETLGRWFYFSAGSLRGRWFYDMSARQWRNRN